MAGRFIECVKKCGRQANKPGRLCHICYEPPSSTVPAELESLEDFRLFEAMRHVLQSKKNPLPVHSHCRTWLRENVQAFMVSYARLEEKYAPAPLPKDDKPVEDEDEGTEKVLALFAEEWERVKSALAPKGPAA